MAKLIWVSVTERVQLRGGSLVVDWIDEYVLYFLRPGGAAETVLILMT